MGTTNSRTARIFALLTLAAQAYAAPARNPLLGEWRIQVDIDGGTMPSILRVTQGKAGTLAAKWISIWGVNEVEKIEREGNRIRLAWTAKLGGQEMAISFAGTLAKGKLSGTLSSDRGSFQATGERIRPIPAAAGTWDVKVSMGERVYAGTLIVKADPKGTLSAEWRSERGEHAISDVEFAAGKLRFTWKSTFGEREFESRFEGTVKGNVLVGTARSERGEARVEGARVGGPWIGTWELEIASDAGPRDQILKVHPDLSGMIGPLPIEKIDVEGSSIRFKTSATLRDRTFEIGFAGERKHGTLSGELETSMGKLSVEGRKALPPRRAPAKKPDVIFVPTPQEVVEKMLELAKVGKDDVVYDLGCGDGRIVVTAAKKYGCRCVGYDIDPQRVEESRKNVKENGVEDLVRIEQEDIFTLDLRGASVITLYLLPSLNVKLIPQLEKLEPGSRIVSHDFDMRGVKPDAVVEVKSSEGYGEHTIYLWTTPLKKEAEGGA